MNQPGRSSVFLVGPMGSGKTAVGRQLARRLDLTFHDSDAEIEARTGVDIAYIFEREGEAGFRERERHVIDELSRLPGIVLATGGGAVLAEENRRHLRERGRVVYLETSLQQQLQRTRRGDHRPLLFTDDPRGRLETLMSQRGPLYREVAELVVPTDGRRIGAVAADIVAWLDRTAAGTAE